jgi:hypothetical protein
VQSQPTGLSVFRHRQMGVRVRAKEREGGDFPSSIEWKANLARPTEYHRWRCQRGTGSSASTSAPGPPQGSCLDRGGRRVQRPARGAGPAPADQRQGGRCRLHEGCWPGPALLVTPTTSGTAASPKPTSPSWSSTSTPRAKAATRSRADALAAGTRSSPMPGIPPNQPSDAPAAAQQLQDKHA